MDPRVCPRSSFWVQSGWPVRLHAHLLQLELRHFSGSQCVSSRSPLDAACCLQNNHCSAAVCLVCLAALLFLRAGSARISLLSAQDMRRRHGSANWGPHALSPLLCLFLSLSLPPSLWRSEGVLSAGAVTSFVPADCHFTMGVGEYGTYEPDRRKDSPEPPPAGGGKKSLKRSS